MDKMNKYKNKIKHKSKSKSKSKSKQAHINRISDKYIADDFFVEQLQELQEPQTLNYKKQIEQQHIEQQQFQSNYNQLKESMEILYMMGLGGKTSKEYSSLVNILYGPGTGLGIGTITSTNNLGILRPPAYTQTQTQTKKQPDVYTHTDADIATLQQLNHLMNKILSNNTETLELKRNIIRSLYNNLDFKKLVNEIISKQNELDKMTEECHQTYQSFTASSKYSYNFDQKTEEIKDKLSSSISIYEQILKIKDSIIQLLNNKLNGIKEKVKNFKNLYDNTTSVIKELLDYTYNPDAIIILEQRMKYIDYQGDNFEPLVKYEGMISQINHYTTSDIYSMSNGLIAMDNKSFVDDKLTEIVEWNEIVLDDSEGAHRADQLDLDYLLDTINSSLSDKSIFDFKYFEDWLNKLDIDKDDIMRQIKSSLNNIDKLCKTNGTRFNFEYPDMETYLAELYKTDNYDNTKSDNHIVKLLINCVYNGCLGDMMVLSSFYMIIVFFVYVYMSPKYEVDVLDGTSSGNYMKFDLNRELNDLPDENLMANGRNYTGLKNDNPIMDIIMTILLFKFKLMLVIRDRMNRIIDVLVYQDRRTLLIEDIYIIDGNDYNQHGFNQLVTFVDIGSIGDICYIIHDNMLFEIGGIKEKLYDHILSNQYLLFGLATFDASNQGQKDNSYNYALNGGNDTLLSLAISETYNGKNARYRIEIYNIMIHLGLCNIYVNDRIKNRINMIRKSCGYYILYHAGNGNMPGYTIFFHDYLEPNAFDLPNDHRHNVFSGKNNADICGEIEKTIFNLNWDEIMSLDNGGSKLISDFLSKDQHYEYPDIAGNYYDETTVLLIEARKKGILGDIMVLFIYNVIINLVMFYYSNQDIIVTNGTNNIDIKTFGNVLINRGLTIMQHLIWNFYLLLGRFIYLKDYINQNNDIANRQNSITGNGINCTDFYGVQGSYIYLFFHDNLGTNTTKRAFIIDFLTKMHIGYDPKLSNGSNAAINTVTAMNELYISCRQLGALLYGYCFDDKNDITGLNYAPAP